MRSRYARVQAALLCILGVVIILMVAGVGAVEEGEVLALPHAGFEDGAGSWSIPRGSPFAGLSGEQAASGDTSLQIVDTSGDGGSNVTSSAVELPSEGVYELRGKVFPVSGSGLGIYARLFDSEGKALPGNGHLLGLGGSERRWMPFSKEFLAPRSADTVRIWVHSYNAAKVSAYLDDFQIAFVKGRDDGMMQDLSLIKERLTARELPSTASREAILELVTSLGEDGGWPDIDYENDNRASWKPSRHMGRILTMARAYRSSEHPLYEDPALKQATLRAYDFWMREDFTCPNWWYNQIGIPRQLYRAMLLVEDELTDEQKRAGIEILKRAKLGMTGQNLVWVAEVTIGRGCLEKDPWVVMTAFRRIADEIRISSGEGIQADFSFYQHGTQLYSGGYGKGFSIDCPKFAQLAHGTAFAFSEEKIEILSGYLLEGQRWMVRGPTFDYSACGREISRKGGGSATGVIRACNSMLAIDPPRKQEFELFLERLEAGESVPEELQLTGNQDFWRSEFMTHHRPELYFSVRMTSPQVVQTETCNRENLHGQLLSDGLTYIMRDGLEYRDIFPVWDWRRLPGITSEHTGEAPGVANGRRGQREFVGGVSDGMYGTAAMDFVRSSLSARKAWFFFDNEVVCLGADINCSSEHPVWTSVNQCNADGEVVIRDESRARAVQEGSETLHSPSWVHHDGLAYVFPEAASIRVRNEIQTGSWWYINRVYSKDEIERRVFSLGINHGVAPEGGSYAYIVAPAENADSAAEYARALPIDVVENSPSLQAVHDAEAAVAGIVFWQPGEARIGEDLTVSVDAPCLVLVGIEDHEIALTASNPANEPLDLTVTLSARLRGDGCKWDAEARHSEVQFSLPSGMYAGQSVVRRLQRQ